MKIAVLGDSISSRNLGAAGVSWPELLESLMRSMGQFGISVCNYSLPGQNWFNSLSPDGGLIREELPAVEAIKKDGADIVLLMMGQNDSMNPNALADALAVKAALQGFRVIYIREDMFDADHPNATSVTEERQQAVDAVYDALGFEGPAGVCLWKLYAMGMTNDSLHPTEEGRKWIASSVYMYLQTIIPLTIITRNIAWLWEIKTSNPAQYQQMRNYSARAA